MTILDQPILVTGATGFFGRHIVTALRAAGATEVIAVGSSDYDLTEVDSTDALFYTYEPHVVIHAAADVGGIGYNQLHGFDILTNNVRMNTNVLSASLEYGVEKFVGIGSVCAYPADTLVPFGERALWSGYPEPTNAPYGISKRLLLAASQAARRDHGLNAVHVIPANLYGPGDTYDLRRAHVIPAMIRKMDQAQRNGTPVTLFGTGRATRDFLYVEDAAQAVVRALTDLDNELPMNIGTGHETSIAELAHAIAALMDFDGGIVWDTSQPDGQQRRALDLTSMAIELAWLPPTTLEAGLRATIADYRARFAE